jgi:hypothetical protein
MGFLRWVVVVLLATGTATAAGLTWFHVGMEGAEDEISLRQESVQQAGGFFPAYAASRGHLGGGLGGGK